MTFRAGIIAAGEGSRLADLYPQTVKPLVRVAGRPLSHWIVASLELGGASDVAFLTNSRGALIPPGLMAAFPGIRFDFFTADTASSFESFRLVSQRLATKSDAFLVSTVDAIIPAEDVARFWLACSRSSAVAGLALTEFVDDEKPLWADVDDSGWVTAVGDDARARNRVTCGLYYMTRGAAEILPEPATHPRLRDFWRTLVSSGRRVAGHTLSKTLDIDRPEDIAAAEAHFAARGAAATLSSETLNP